MKKISNLVMMALLTVGMGLTSCEDILGHWEKPTPVTPAPTPEPTMLETPLTLEAKTAGVIVKFTIDASVVTNPVEYSTYNADGTVKTDWASFTSVTEITLTNVGDYIQFRGSNAAYSSDISSSTISCSSGDCCVYGNIMSLIDKDNFATDATPSLTGDYAFKRLFDGNDHLYSHDTKELLLPATTLTQNCYNGIFRDCTGLTAAPALPATTLAESCYFSMFQGCTDLTAAPALPATTLAQSCYNSMFKGCTGLTAAPALPATTLVKSCYGSMFYGCEGLTAAPALPAETLAQLCYESMFSGCTGLTAAPALPATTLAEGCYQSMFYGCTGLTETPHLAAETLVAACYGSMFQGCIGLTKAYVKADYNMADCSEMFDGCTNATESTFYSAYAANYKSTFGLSSWQEAAYE